MGPGAPAPTDRFPGLVIIAAGKHPTPSRTRQLSAAAPMVLRLKTWESRSSPDLESGPKPTGRSLERYQTHPGAGWSSPVARQAHNLKAAGSNPAPATKILRVFKRLNAALRGGVCVSSTCGSTVEARGAEVLRAST